MEHGGNSGDCQLNVSEVDQDTQDFRASVIKDIQRLKHDFAKMSEDIDTISSVGDDIKALRADIKDLLFAWQTAGGIVKFTKFLASLLTAIGVIVVAYKTAWSKW